MNRKTAIAAAVAIAMSLTSGAVALGANVGALGFSHAKPTAATQDVLPAARRVVTSASKPAGREREPEDRAGATQIGADRAALMRGEHYD